jgi:hypothetical protein
MLSEQTYARKQQRENSYAADDIANHIFSCSEYSDLVGSAPGDELSDSRHFQQQRPCPNVLTPLKLKSCTTPGSYGPV